MNRDFSAERRTNAEAEIGSKDIVVKSKWNFPLYGSTKSTRLQKKRQEDPGVPFIKTRECPKVPSYGDSATLQGGTEERSCSEGRNSGGLKDRSENRALGGAL